MAVDTAQKRAAALGVCVPTAPLLVPNGAINTRAERSQLTGVYEPSSGGGGGSPGTVSAGAAGPLPAAWAAQRRRRRRQD